MKSIRNKINFLLFLMFCKNFNNSITGQYFDLKFSGYIPRRSQPHYTYKLFENICNLLLLLKCPYNCSIPYFLHKAMFRTNLVISTPELVLITINDMSQIEVSTATTIYINCR
jgi:hypothetical protein